uniref:uncharacterized protein LOC117165429 n=1 Tax=Bombus vancouverensis nearcticus TaxID=2705178 RepID=UPI00143AE035|nr:uncharacterized protein LOC117165429 [Bombus vancouverensis nearcticus]
MPRMSHAQPGSRTPPQPPRPSPNRPLHHDLLATAQIKVLNKQAQPIRARALLDTGTSMNFMTDKLANSLGIKQRRCAIQIGALDNLSTTAKRYTTATITSTDGKYNKTLRFLVIAAMSTFIPSEPIDPSGLGLPRNIQLADPQFHCPAPIDVLLSTGSTFASLCIGHVNLAQPGEPELRLLKTRFGWVIGGSPTSQAAINTFHATTTALQEDLARFWEIDEGPATTHLSESERLCEEHFRNHVRRTKEGRYIVALPFNEKLSSLGSSKAAAMSRLASLHRRFQHDKQYETAYSAESSDTTKLRVVFDGSASSTTGVSLNDALHTDPKLQEDLRNILLRFRSFQYILTGDIEKMYRQFILRPEDRPYQKILWRADNGEIETYRLNTVTFGLSTAPYLAMRCLKQLAEDEGP